MYSQSSPFEDASRNTSSHVLHPVHSPSRYHPLFSSVCPSLEPCYYDPTRSRQPAVWFWSFLFGRWICSLRLFVSFRGSVALAHSESLFGSGENSRGARVRFARATSILTHPPCKSTNALLKSATTNFDDTCHDLREEEGGFCQNVRDVEFLFVFIEWCFGQKLNFQVELCAN